MTLEKKLQLLAAGIVAVAAAGSIALMMGWSGFHSYAVKRSETVDKDSYSVLGFLRDSVDEPAIAKGDDRMKMNGHDFAMELPRETDFSAITYESDPMARSFTFRVPGILSNYFSDYTIAGKSDGIADMTYAVRDGFGVIEITFDHITEVKHTVSGRYLYFDFLRPQERYGHVVVIDAGHGGSDPGAGERQGAREKDIDLAIMLKLKELFDADKDHDIGVYYTRTDDRNVPLQARVGLANDAGADIFLSIHNNSTASGRMSEISGTEVMYRVSDETGASKALAERVENHLLAALGSADKGLVAGDEIYIIRTSQAPVALAEVGFMTNAAELAALSSDDYQEKAAKAMYDAIIEQLYGQ